MAESRRISHAEGQVTLVIVTLSVSARLLCMLIQRGKDSLKRAGAAAHSDNARTSRKHVCSRGGVVNILS
jgi:hypothetical protein